MGKKTGEGGGTREDGERDGGGRRNAVDQSRVRCSSGRVKEGKTHGEGGGT